MTAQLVAVVRNVARTIQCIALEVKCKEAPEGRVATHPRLPGGEELSDGYVEKEAGEQGRGYIELSVSPQSVSSYMSQLGH